VSGEQISDPYLGKPYFEIWWALRNQKSWERGRMASDPMKAPQNWGGGFKDDAKEAWLARAFFHVTPADAKGN
jgi:hypothetical protein